MLSPSTKNKTDAIELTDPVKAVDGEPFPAAKEEKKFSIIIPAYNEENRIGQTIEDLEARVPSISEIIVIFDGNDHTPEVAIGSGKKVKVLRYNNRLGHGGAVFEGIKHSKEDIVCFIDADGSAPAFEVYRICSFVNDITPAVFGSRSRTRLEIKSYWKD